jgi:hypothetical protein
MLTNTLKKGDDPSLAINNDINDEMSYMCAKVSERNVTTPNALSELPMQYYNAQGRRFLKGCNVYELTFRICAMKSTMGENSTKNDSKPIKSIQVQKIIKQVRAPK